MTDKTIADVLDNIVNQLSNGVQALGNAIQKVAPDAWKILVHRQKVLAINDIILGVALIIGLCLLSILYKKYLYNKFVEWIKEDVDYVISQTVCAVIFGVTSIIIMMNAVNYISQGIVRYNTIEYEAAKEVLTMAKQ